MEAAPFNLMHLRKIRSAEIKRTAEKQHASAFLIDAPQSPARAIFARIEQLAMEIHLPEAQMTCVGYDKFLIHV